MNIPLITDLDALRGRRQQLIDENLRRINKKRLEHHYAVGDKVWIKYHDPNKMEEKLHGPYRIERLYTNGTVRVEINPGVTIPISIRKLVPYKGP